MNGYHIFCTVERHLPKPSASLCPNIEYLKFKSAGFATTCISVRKHKHTKIYLLCDSCNFAILRDCSGITIIFVFSLRNNEIMTKLTQNKEIMKR